MLVVSVLLWLSACLPLLATRAAHSQALTPAGSDRGRRSVVPMLPRINATLLTGGTHAAAKETLCCSPITTAQCYQSASPPQNPDPDCPAPVFLGSSAGFDQLVFDRWNPARHGVRRTVAAAATAPRGAIQRQSAQFLVEGRVQQGRRPYPRIPALLKKPPLDAREPGPDRFAQVSRRGVRSLSLARLVHGRQQAMPYIRASENRGAPGRISALQRRYICREWLRAEYQVTNVMMASAEHHGRDQPAAESHIQRRSAVQRYYAQTGLDTHGASRPNCATEVERICRQALHQARRCRELIRRWPQAGLSSRHRKRQVLRPLRSARQL